MNCPLKGVPYNLTVKANKFEGNIALRIIFGEKERRNEGKKEGKEGGKKNGKREKGILNTVWSISSITTT